MFCEDSSTSGHTYPPHPHPQLMQSPGYFLSHGVLPALFHPGAQPAEAGRAGDIVDEEHCVDVSVVVLHHGFTEALLSCRVPQLELTEGGGMEQKGRK